MFDLEAARKAGYGDDVIARALAEEQGVDFDAALKAGYSPSDMLPSLMEGAQDKGFFAKAGDFISGALADEPSIADQAEAYSAKSQERAAPGNIAPLSEAGYNKIASGAVESPQDGGVVARATEAAGTDEGKQAELSAVDDVFARAEAEKKADQDLYGEFKRENPNVAAFASGTRSLASSIADIPQLSNDLIKQIAIDPFRHLFGEESLPPTARFQIAKDFEQAGKDYMPAIAKKSLSELNGYKEVGSWIAAQAAMQSPQIVASTSAALIQKLRAAYLGIMGLSSGASNYQENLEKGVNQNTAMKGALTNAAFEVIGESLPFGVFDSVGKYIRKLPPPQRGALIADALKKTMLVVGAGVAQQASEGIGEGVTQIGQNASERYVIGDKSVGLMDRVPEAVAIGTIMGTPTAVAQSYRTALNPSDILDKSKTVSESIDTAASILDESLDVRSAGLMSAEPVQTQPIPQQDTTLTPVNTVEEVQNGPTITPAAGTLDTGSATGERDNLDRIDAAELLGDDVLSPAGQGGTGSGDTGDILGSAGQNQPVPDGGDATVTQTKTRPRFNSPHEDRVASHLKQADENGDSESVKQRYMPKHVPDIQTGYFGKEDKVETVKRAQQFSEEHNTTAHFIYGDFANIGGLNEYHNNDNDKADIAFGAQAKIFESEVKKYSPDAVFVRTGGDEVGVTVIGATTQELEAAKEATRIRILDYATENGLNDIPRKAMRDKEGNVLPSDPRSPFGIGMYIGIAEIKPGKSLDTIFSEASEGMNAEKVKGRNGLLYGKNYEQTGGIRQDDRAGALDRRPRGVRGSVGPETQTNASQGGATAPAMAEEAPRLDSGAEATQPVKLKKRSKKANTLLTAVRDMGGLSLNSKRDVAGEKMAPGGYNQLFRSDAKNTLEGLAGKGELDDFLPYELRFATNDKAGSEVADMQDAVEWIKDRIRSGERIIPYDAQMELDQREIEAQALIDAVEEELSYDEINAQLQLATDAEREDATNARIFNAGNEESGAGRSAGTEAGKSASTETGAQEQAFQLKGQTNAEIAANEARAEDTTAEDKAAADRASEVPLTLTAQSQEKTDTPTTQAGMFTPDGRATVAAENKATVLDKDMPLFHGTNQGNKFSAFDVTTKQNTGVGSNAFNQGHYAYLTQSREAAQWFADRATENADLRANKTPSDQPGEVLEFTLKKGAKVMRIENMPQMGKADALIKKAEADGVDAIIFRDPAFDIVEGDRRVADMLNSGQPMDTVLALNHDRLAEAKSAEPKPEAKPVFAYPTEQAALSAEKRQRTQGFDEGKVVLHPTEAGKFAVVPMDSEVPAKATKAKKLEVLKAQANGKITGDQGAALKELADAGEHAAVDEVLKPEAVKKEPPIVKFRQEAAQIEATLPAIRQGYTRLWRGNRSGEVGIATRFTNDLPGIALPFRDGYNGPLSYVDVKTDSLASYEEKGVAAVGAEFTLPGEIAKNAREVDAVLKPKTEAIKQGEVGGMMSSGEVVLTATGRETTPFPQIKTGTRSTNTTVKQGEQWLIDNAIAEAKARGDEFNLLQFENIKKPSQSDKDSAELYLFHTEQPQVLKPLLKPLRPTEIVQQNEALNPVAAKRQAYENQDNNFYYVAGTMGMKSNGSFTDEKRYWMTFTKETALDMESRNVKPYGATKRGTFNGTVSGEKLIPAPKGATPQVISTAQAESIIIAAADSVKTLRSSDVGRVLDETPANIKLSMARYIKDNRADLADEVDSVMAEEIKPSKPLRMDGTTRPEHAKPAPTPEFSVVHPKAQEKFSAAWEAKDVPSMQEYLDPANKGLRAEFESRAGLKLPKTISGTDKAVADYFAQPASAEAAPEFGTRAEQIQDFGEKIIGARKEYAAAYKDRMSEAKTMDVLAQPLSKSWPEPNYEKLIEAGSSPRVVGLIRSMRDEIPNKPGKSYKQKTWAAQVELLRDTADKMLNDKEFADKYEAEFKKTEHLRLDDAINGRAELYELLGHEKSLKGIHISRSQYGVYNGVVQNPPKIIWEVVREAKATAFGNMPRTLGSGDTRQAAIDAFKKAYTSLDTAAKDTKTKFEIYADRYAKAGDKGQYYIGKKVGRNVLKIKTGMDSVKEARAYITEHNEELSAILEKKKEVPNERYDINQPRVGQDMRNAQDVTPEMFSEAFGFRGVQFGNYVEGKRRQKDLNDAYDALMDLAAVLDIPPKAISLNGELGLAFGARGSGGIHPASAHYEPGQVVINLTKGSGAGSLAHEWFHGLDNYFSRMGGKKDEYITDSRDVKSAARDAGYPIESKGIRKEMIDAFGSVVKSINQTAIKQRSASLDGRRAKEYWGTGIEMAARSFERYVIAKLQDSGFSNDYLANVVSEEYWNAAEELGVGEGGSYPYPTVSELPGIRAGFDHFFQTIESKETDKGTALYSRAQSYPESAITEQDAIDKGFKLKVYRGISKAKPFNDTGTVWATTSKEVAQAYAEEVFGYDDAAVIAMMVNTDGIKKTNMRTASDEVLDSFEYNTFTSPQDVGIYQNSDDSPLGNAYPHTAVHVPIENTVVIDNGDISFSRSVDNANTEVGEYEATRGINQLQAAVRKDLGNDEITISQSVPLDQLARAGGTRSAGEARSFELAQAIAAHFGQKVVTFENRTPKIFDFNGVSFDGKIFLNAKANRPAHVIFGHEFLHELKKGNQPAYDKLMTVLEPMMKNVEGFRKAENIESSRSVDYVKEELAANLVGNRFAEKSFWRMLMLRAPKHFKAIVELAVKLLSDIHLNITGNAKLAGDEFITDMDKAREAIADAVASYRKMTGDKTFEPKFSRAQQDKIPLQGGETGNPASWDAPGETFLDDVIYKLQNKNVDLKRVIEAVKATGTELADKYNAYLQEELFHGRAAKRTQDFVNTEMRPLLDDMRMRGLTIEQLDEYLHARHAKEANALIAERDPDMPDGGSGMTNQQADDYMDGLSDNQKTRLDAVAKRVDAILAKTRDLYTSYGLVSKNETDAWSKMFEHYVPLMREDHDGGMGMGQGFSVKGKEVKHRTGSTAKVVDILANIALQREKAITRGEKNRVAVSLAGLVKLNPNPDFWTFGKVPTERVLNEKTGLVEERIDPMFKSRPNAIIAKISDGKGNVVERAVIFNENNDRAMRMAESLKNLDAPQLGGLLGASAKVTRYFASVNTQYNPVFGITNIVRDVQGMALNLDNTALAKHKLDVIKAIPAMLKGIYQDARMERKGRANDSETSKLWEELQDEGGMTGYRDLYRNSEDRANAIKHELDPHNWVNNKWGKVFTAGGILKVPLTKAQDVAGPIFNWLSDYNQTLEGATRLATYKVALDNGFSKQQAASLAKNITVNFNRKGQIGQQAGALYAFFNAAMQGTARIGETIFAMDKGDIKTLRLNKTGKAIVYGGVLLGVIQAVAMAASGLDDDDPPEFVRERSLIIPFGIFQRLVGISKEDASKKYISIPMPLGYHVLPNIGRIATEFAMNGFKKPTDHVIKLAGIFAEAFNPIGSAGLSMQTIAPTPLDPFAALAENKDWTGKHIAKPRFDTVTPGFSHNKDTATTLSKLIAEALNTLTGGDKYTAGAFSPTADQLDYLAGQVGGGVWREGAKLEQAVVSMFTGEELPTYKIPLVGRFYGDGDSKAGQGGAYYSNLQRVKEVEAGLKGRLEDDLPVDQFKRDNPEYRLIGRAKLAESTLRSLQKRKREMIEHSVPREKIKLVEERITQVMKQFNESASKLETAP